MGHWIECEKCKKVYRYDPGEIENTGTVWHPIWTVKCGNCDSTITFDQGSIKFFDRAQISQTKEGVAISQLTTKPGGRERAEKGDIREYWAQEYVIIEFETGLRPGGRRIFFDEILKRGEVADITDRLSAEDPGLIEGFKIQAKPVLKILKELPGCRSCLVKTLVN